MPTSFGVTEYNGKQYYEKFHIMTINGFVLGAGLTLLNQRLVISETIFCLKALVRRKVTAANLFRFRLGNTDGTWFSSCGVGAVNDRVVDTLLFGDNGAFPFEIWPYIFYERNGSITFDIEDMSGAGNTIDFGFIGSQLFPA